MEKEKRRKYLWIEEQLIELSQLDAGRVQSLDFEVAGDQLLHYTLIKNPGKQKMVVLHGYNCSSVYFIWICQYLQSQFEILLVDLPGFAFSQAPSAKLETCEEWINFFVQPVHSLISHL